MTVTIGAAVSTAHDQLAAAAEAAAQAGRALGGEADLALVFACLFTAGDAIGPGAVG
ncbi:MAG: hypothetical protein WCB67_11035 [Solirubrobacteraceae bacterium]